MKVLHIGKYFPPYRGGMETYQRDLMVALGSHGVDCTGLVHRSEISLRSTREQYREGDSSFGVTRAAVWARLLFTPISPTFPLLLRQMIRREQPDILHLHMPNVSVFWALLLPSARRLPWVVHWQSDVLASEHHLGLKLFYALYKPFESAVLKRCRKVIASSPPYLASSKTLARFRDKCTVIPLGIRPFQANQAPYPPSASDSAEPLKVLAVGRLAYYKGFKYLVRAMAEVPNARLDLVGSGEQESELRSLIAKEGLSDRVTLHGQLGDEELCALLTSCDCLCLPSIERTESFGVVLLEAMSCGKPCLVTAVPGSGMSWVVDDGQTGRVVTPASSSDIAAVLGHFAEDRDTMHALGEGGRDKFLRQFHIDQSAAKVASLYESIG